MTGPADTGLPIPGFILAKILGSDAATQATRKPDLPPDPAPIRHAGPRKDSSA